MNIPTVWRQYWKVVLVVLPLLLAPMFPVLALVDMVRPWVGAEPFLDGRANFCVGMGSGFEETNTGRVNYRQRSYLIPREFTVLSVTKHEGEPIESFSSNFAFWLLAVVQIVSLWLSMQYSIPMILSSYRRATVG